MALVPQNQFQIVDTDYDDLRRNFSYLLGKLQNCVLNFETVGNTVIEKLMEKQELIKTFHTKTNYIRTATTATGFASSAIMGVGLLMAPVTMGVSLPLAAGGAGIVACTAAGIFESDYYDKSKEFWEEIELILKELENPGKFLNDIVKEIEIAISKMARSVYTHFETVKDKDQVTLSILLCSSGLGIAFTILNIGLLIYSWSKKLKIEETIEKLIVMIREEIKKWKSYLEELQQVCLVGNLYMFCQRLQYVVEQYSQRERNQMEEFQKSTQQIKEEFEEHKRQMKQDADERELRMKEEADERERRIIQDAEDRQREMKDELNEVKSQLHQRDAQIEEIYKMLQERANNKK